MARPFKSGVDYFPLDVVVDDKVKILEAEHGIVGFGVWVKLHQKIYSCNYWIDWDKKAKIIFSNEVNVDINTVNDVINSCLEWDIFSKNVFNKYSVLTSRGIQKRYFKICEKRLRVEIVEEYTLINVPIVDRQEIVIIDINSINSGNSTQSKVKEKKVKGKEIIKPENITNQTWQDWLSHRKSKKAKVTQTVINGFITQAEKAGISLEDALKESIERNWIGFKADWYLKDKRKNEDEQFFADDFDRMFEQPSNMIELQKGKDYE